MILSFNWTLAPVLAGEKTFTWREWNVNHARKFHQGDQVTIYDKQPRSGGKPRGLIVMTKPPIYRCSDTLSDLDWEREGFKWLQEHPEHHPEKLWGKPFDPAMLTFEAFEERRRKREMGWDVRFELVEIFG